MAKCVSLKTLRLCTINCSGKLNKDSGTELVELFDFVDFKNLDLICLQETGFLLNNFSLRDDLFRKYMLFINASGSNKHESVGILIRRELLRFLDPKIFRHPSGRLMSVTMRFPGCKSLRVFSLYQHSGLEGFAPNDRRCILAAELVDVILKIWQEGVCNIVLAGDFNEVLGPDERSSNRQGSYGCRFLSLLLDQGLVDKSSRSEFTCCRATARGQTFSKLDRFLVSPGINQHFSSAAVFNAPHGALNSDHFPVLANFDLDCSFRRSSRPYRRKCFSARDFPEDQEKMYLQMLNEAVTPLYTSLLSTSDSELSQRESIDVFFVALVKLLSKTFLRCQSQFQRQRKDISNEIQCLCRDLRDLRFIKREVSRVCKLVASDVAIDFETNDYILHLVEIFELAALPDFKSTCQFLNKHLRTLIRTRFFALKKLSRENFLTFGSWKYKCFTERRSFSNDKFIRASRTLSNPKLLRVFDSEAKPQRDVTSESEVHRVLVREAKKILSQPT